MSFHLIALHMSAQDTMVNNGSNAILVPYQEQIYLHPNTTMAFVGEYMYYTLYCLRENTGQLSDVSKIAYVKLVDQDKNVVLNHKIKLEQGIGDSNFFIPSSIPSGNYMLLAYTKWMLNNGRNYFYSEDITILNPYTSDQAIFRSENEKDTIVGVGTEAVTNTSIENGPLQMELGKTAYVSREPISLKMVSHLTEGFGNYSISVKKVDELEKANRKSTLTYITEYPPKEKNGQSILPEMRGELLTGRVIGDMGKGDMVIGASFPGEDYLFKMATPNDEGQFFINVAEDYSSENIYLQTISGKDGGYRIALDEEEGLDLGQLRFENFELNKEMAAIIQERSVYNQIENAYYSSRPDTILIGKPNDRFYGTGTMTYVLDDYTRFSSIKETFVEVIEHVWIQENGKGKPEFHVRPIAPYMESGELPLVFVDGLLLQDHERLLTLSAAQVKSITISRDHHFYGNKTFQGIVDVVTFNSDYYQSYYSKDVGVHKLFKPNEDKNYYHQSYEGELKNVYRRLPDFRYQLLWLPRYGLSEKEQEVVFYSSDIKGKYEISLEGFTYNGIPVSLKKHFVVE